MFSPYLAGPGSHQIIYTITGPCGAADTANIIIKQAPNYQANGVPESCTGANDGTAGINLSGGLGPYHWLWSTADTISTVSGLAPGSYSVTVTDANNCKISTIVEVLASTTPCEIPDTVIYVPNVFTPNGDGVNDELYVHGQSINELKFVIYDRWGEKVFESEFHDNGHGGVTKGWDGTYHGKPMDEAVYVWYLKGTFLNNHTFKRKGNVTLLR
jgi:gliding motility-associated-like protein